MTDEDVPSAETLRRAQMLWEQSGLDLRQAKRFRREKRWLEGSFLAIQAALNALTALCGLQGHFRLPNYSAVQLASLCAQEEPAFEALLPTCRALDEAQEQSPFAEIPAPEAKAAGTRTLAHSTEVISAVRTHLKKHRKKYFKP